MLFLLSFMFCMFLGFLSYYKPSKYSFTLVLFVLLYPTSTSFSFLNVYEGIFFYDSVVVGILIAHFFKIKTDSLGTQLNLNRQIVIITCLYFVYCLFAIYSSAQLKYILKDLRPLILIIECFIIYNLVIVRSQKWSIKSINVLVALIGIMSLIKLIYFQMSLSHINDNFYNDNSYRYLDAGTYFCVAYLLTTFCTKSNVNFSYYSTYIALFSSLLCVMVANSRFVIISMLLIIIAYNYRNIKKVLGYIMFSFVVLSTFIFYSYYSGSERVLDAFQVEALLYQITTRYEPALRMMDSFSISQYLLGTGIGEPFYIPWFSYRDLDPYNINIDSGYFTFYCKFGLISIFLIYSFLNFFNFSKSNNGNSPLFWFLSCVFIVSATPYQIYAIGIFMGYVLSLHMGRVK